MRSLLITVLGALGVWAVVAVAVGVLIGKTIKHGHGGQPPHSCPDCTPRTVPDTVPTWLVQQYGTPGGPR